MEALLRHGYGQWMRITDVRVFAAVLFFSLIAAPLAGQVAPQILTFNGQTALLTVAVKADKTADFERVMTRMRDALLKSEDPKRRQQAEGWTVVRLQQPLPDGTVAYVHVINPVIPGVDYSVMQTLYSAFPDERQALYDAYRGAFDRNVSLALGSIAIDLSEQ